MVGGARPSWFSCRTADEPSEGVERTGGSLRTRGANFEQPPSRPRPHRDPHHRHRRPQGVHPRPTRTARRRCHAPRPCRPCHRAYEVKGHGFVTAPEGFPAGCGVGQDRGLCRPYPSDLTGHDSRAVGTDVNDGDAQQAERLHP